VYVTTSPTEDTELGLADFSIVSEGAAGASTVADDGGDSGVVTPAGGVAVAVAVLLTEPASMSAWVTV
jgi:hypothetical protein